MEYDLAVAYRIYPKVSGPGIGLPFSDDKLRMAEVCLRSFRRALGDLRAKIWVILDGCPPQYSDLFRDVFAGDDLVLVPLNNAGNHATFIKQLDILSEQRDAELVYFAEDDYFYLPDAFRLMIEFLHQPNVDFITPYDHPDCYSLDLHRGPKWLRLFGDHHWRTAASTCLTFLTRRSTLLKTRRVFASYGRGNADCSIWLELTKQQLFRPVDFLRWLRRERLFAKILVKAWIFGFTQILLGRRYKLWAPLPAVATHLANGLLSPGTDWQELMHDEAFVSGAAQRASRDC